MPKNTASKRPIDLRKAATQERQTIMAEHLRSAGLGRLIRGTDGQIELPKIYCQRRSAKLRWKLQREAIAAIDDIRSGELRVLATVIFSQAKSADGPFDPKLLKRVRKSLADLADTTPEIRVMVGCIEADFNRTAEGRTHWEFSAHLLMAVRARATADVKEFLKSGLELSPTSDTRRPVLVRALYNPAGAAQYVFKALAVGPICERSSWVGQGPTGKPRTFTRKVRLKRPQLISWLASLSGHDLTDRVIWHSRKKL